MLVKCAQGVCIPHHLFIHTQIKCSYAHSRVCSPMCMHTRTHAPTQSMGTDAFKCMNRKMNQSAIECGVMDSFEQNIFHLNDSYKTKWNLLTWKCNIRFHRGRKRETRWRRYVLISLIIGGKRLARTFSFFFFFNDWSNTFFSSFYFFFPLVLFLSPCHLFPSNK